jgi:hypothetical protein
MPPRNRTLINWVGTSHVAITLGTYKTGVPPRTRTLTDGFGDRGAAITPEIHNWYFVRESNPHQRYVTPLFYH